MLRPTLEHLSRPMVSPNMLETPSYEIEIVDFSLGSINKNPKEFKNLRQIELHPLEWDGLIVLSNPKKDKERIEIFLGNITDIQLISHTKGHIRKKEDLTIQIIYKDNIENQHNILVINLDDKYVNECFQIIQSLRQKELDSGYWTYRSLTFQSNTGQTKTVEIYPLTPFLTEGENMLWHNLKTDGIRHKKVVWIQVLTNYRVFFYDYIQHAGTMVLLPGLQDIVVNNQRHTYNTNSVGFYSGSYYNNAKGSSMTVGDIVFIAEGKPYVIFSQVGDPHGLASVVKSLRNQTHMRVGVRAQTEPVREAQTKVSGSDNKTQTGQTRTITSNTNNAVNIICNKCGNNSNPKGSKFCNNCGFKLQNNCPNCGNINPENTAFCNQCGFTLA